MSCIYGPRQFGTEDQGWVAHFLIRALKGETITVYGDGKQVRDLLYVGDLVDAFETVSAPISRVCRVPGAAAPGASFNLGGGPDNTLSLLELFEHIERMHGARAEASLRGLAHRRPALLRERHAKLPAGSGVAGLDAAPGRVSASSTPGCVKRSPGPRGSEAPRR